MRFQLQNETPIRHNLQILKETQKLYGLKKEKEKGGGGFGREEIDEKRLKNEINEGCNVGANRKFFLPFF